MSKVKFLEDGKEDSAGHINEVTAIDAVTIHSAGKFSFVSVQLNKYKNVQAKLDGKSSSIDRVQPEKLYASDLGMSALDFNNLIIDALAKKHNLNTIEVEAELDDKSPAEKRQEKELAKAAKLAANVDKVPGNAVKNNQ